MGKEVVSRFPGRLRIVGMELALATTVASQFPAGTPACNSLSRIVRRTPAGQIYTDLITVAARPFSFFVSVFGAKGRGEREQTGTGGYGEGTG